MKKMKKSRIIISVALFFMLMGFWLFKGDDGSEVKADDTQDYCVWETVTYDGTIPISAQEGYLFAGWYDNAVDRNPLGASPTVGQEGYAKFVPAEVMAVKCQTLKDTTEDTESTSIRFVATVDSLEYLSVGFHITVEGKGTKTYRSTGVCEEITADSGAGAYNYSPNLFDLASKYYVTVTMNGIPNSFFDTGFLIQPFWVTEDGTEVEGVSRYVRIADSYHGVLNVPVYANGSQAIDGGTTVTVTVPDGFALATPAFDPGTVETQGTMTISEIDSTARTLTITVPETTIIGKGLLLNLRFKVEGDHAKADEYGFAGMPSSYEFAVSAGSYKFLNVPCRNLAAAYNGSNADTSWYDDAATTFVIATLPEFYGFQKLSQTKDFANKIVQLASDIKINEALTWTIDGTTGIKSAAAPTNTWTPIGTDSLTGTTVKKSFAGTFDGQNHTISGMYISATRQYVGLFAKIAEKGVIQNLRLVDSYIYSVKNSTYSNCGSVVGYLGGTLESVYSDAVIEHTGRFVGGLAGRTEGTGTHIIRDCWFAGQVQGMNDGDARMAGGLLGGAYEGTTQIIGSLNEGAVYNSDGTKEQGIYTGGLVGRAGHSTKVYKLEIKDSISVGRITLLGKTGHSGVGAAVGFVYAGSKGSEWVTAEDVFVVEVEGRNSIGTPESGATISGNIYNLSKDDLLKFTTGDKKDPVYDFDTAWYTAHTTDKEYAITTEDEFCGFALLSRYSSLSGFSGWTIKLGNDIQWTKEYEWVPIGTNSKTFKGTFDGQGHTISGIRIDNQDANTPGIGLFTQTNAVSIVQNLRLVDSTITSAGQNVGSIAGHGNGIFQNIYSSAQVISTYDNGPNDTTNYAGGLIGLTGGGINMSNCQFAGTVSLTSSNGRVAGCLIGRVGKTSSLEHCLNTGTIRAVRTNNTNIGGLVGGLYTETTVLTIKDSLHLGLVEAPNDTVGNLGAIIGTASKGTANIENTYAKQGGCIKKDNVVVNSAYSKTQGIINITENGEAITDIFKAESDLTGEGASRNTALDFNGVNGEESNWVCVDGKLPELRCFLGYTLSTPMTLTQSSEP